MLSARNIHFIILGIILGATSGYIFAFYQVQSTTPPPEIVDSGVPSGHPNVDNQQIQALFNEAFQKNPNDPKLLARYGNFLFSTDRFSEAIDAYQKVLVTEPNNLNVRTDMATAYWNSGQRDQAMTEYNKALEIDPKHINTLHTLFLVQIEGRNDIDAAAGLLKRIEEANPSYDQLPGLKRQLEQERARAPK